MKILILGTAYPYRGGLASYNERLARQFINEGNEVQIFTFTLQYPGFLFPGKTQYSESPAPPDLEIKRTVNSVNPFNWIRTGIKIRSLKPDILILKYWHPFMAPCFGTIARFASRKGKPKVICVFDNVIPHETSFIDTVLTKYFTGSIDAGLVMSKSVGEDLRKFRVNIPVLFNPHPLYDNYGDPVPAEEAQRNLGLSGNYSYMLFFGFIRAYKGLDLLLDAFADNRLRKRNLKLIIAGEFYEDDKPYREKIRSGKLEDDIILFDRFIRDDEVASFFSIADIIVQPYRSATQSGVTQIAYHFGKPMLVTDVGGLSEIVPDGRCGYVVKPDKEAITNAIIDFYDRNRKSEFTEGVIREKANFTWSKLTASIMEAFRGIR
jgi:glycosyltransferase involved in cell wall biosynthesis